MDGKMPIMHSEVKRIKVIGISVMFIVVALLSNYGMISYIENVSGDEVNPDDVDGDGRPDEFETAFSLNTNENDIEWTFLVYVCGDDVPSGNPSGSLLFEMWEFIEKLSWVGCTDNINIVVQFDGNDVINGYMPDQFWDEMLNNRFRDPYCPIPTSTRRFLVGCDTAQQWTPGDWTTSGNAMAIRRDMMDYLWDVTDWPSGDSRIHDETDQNGDPNWEANMADPHTLFEFVDWGMDTFPSDHYCLYINSHGLGVEGFAYDYRPDNNATTTELDVITLPEMNALSTLFESSEKRLDLVNMYSCFMGNLEFGIKFLEFSDYYLASENWMMASGNQDDDTLSSLENNPSWNAVRLAQEFIDDLEYWTRDDTSNPPFNVLDWTPQFGDTRMTYSVLNGSYMTSNLKNDILSFNQNLDGGLNSNQELWYKEKMISAISAADRYPDDSNYPRIQIDYYYFINYWASLITGPPQQDNFFNSLRTSAQNIRSVLWSVDPDNRLISYEKHDQQLQNTKGIAIYLPDTCPDYSIKDYNTPMDQLYWWHVLETCIRLGLIPGPP